MSFILIILLLMLYYTNFIASYLSLFWLFRYH